MKKMRKIYALVLALALVLGMSMTAMADTTNVTAPTASDTATATVKNVEASATVTAYQIVKAKYAEGGEGFVGYVKASDDIDIAIDDVLAPTSDEVTAIAKQIYASDDTKVVLESKTMNPGTPDENGFADFTADLEAGYWVILVRGTVDEIYNPMLVGVYYTVGGSDNTVSSGNDVDANANWTLTTTNAYAKSTEPKIDKSIIENNEETNGNTVAVGDTVSFKIDQMKVPSYSKEYTTVEVKISDVLSDGLTLNQNSVAITVGGVNLDTNNYVIITNNQGFTITLKSEYVLAVNSDTNQLVNADKEIVVTYTATVDDDVALNFAENTNTATLKYTNDPSGGFKEITDKTYTYTFGIDAKLNGTDSEVTQELFKVNENGKVEMTTTTTASVTNPLAGATFTLTNNTTGKVYTATSGADGALSFTGLDEGTYTLKETVAPAGYTLEGKEHTVVITAEHNEDGILDTYSITIDNEATSTYSATYKGGTKVVEKEVVNATGIMNTKLIALPSTGGIGTTIFTVVGCVIMIAAAALFFASRRREAR